MSQQSFQTFRTLAEVEPVLLGAAQPDQVRARRRELRGLLDEFPHALPSERVERLMNLLEEHEAGRPADGRRSAYLSDYGLGGVVRHEANTGAEVFAIPIESFPGHVNNIYLILDGDTRTLVDVGTPLKTSVVDLRRGLEIVAQVWERPVSLREIDNVVLTHGHIDHFGNLGWFRENTEATVHIHALDAHVLTAYEEAVVMAARGVRQFLRGSGAGDDEVERIMALYLRGKEFFQSTTVDVRLRDGQRIINDYLVIHVPGHCPGQIMLRVGNLLLTGDHLIEHITPHQAPEAITPYIGLSHYLASLERVERLEGVRLGLSGHGGPIADPGRRARAITDAHEERLAVIADYCAESARTIQEINLHLFPNQKGYNALLGLEEAGAHVEYLALHERLRVTNLEEVQADERAAPRYLTRGRK